MLFGFNPGRARATGGPPPTRSTHLLPAPPMFGRSALGPLAARTSCGRRQTRVGPGRPACVVVRPASATFWAPARPGATGGGRLDARFAAISSARSPRRGVRPTAGRVRGALAPEALAIELAKPRLATAFVWCGRSDCCPWRWCGPAPGVLPVIVAHGRRPRLSCCCWLPALVPAFCPGDRKSRVLKNMFLGGPL